MKKIFTLIIIILAVIAGGASWLYSRLDIDTCKMRETTKLERKIFVLPDEGIDCSLNNGYSYLSDTAIGVETLTTAYIIDGYVMSKMSEEIDVDEFPERYELASPAIKDGRVAVGDLDFDGINEVYVFKWLGGFQFEIHSFKNMEDGFMQIQ